MECICVILTVVFVASLVFLALSGRYYQITDSKSLVGRTIIVTGAEQGRGFQISLKLAKKKARVIMAVVDENKGKKARQKIVQRTGNTGVVVQHLDVTMMSFVRSFVAWIKEHEKKLDILINNKEMITIQKTMTEEEFELIFAANYLGPFLLTTSMLDLLKRYQGRVVNVGSVLPTCRSTSVDCGNLKAEKSFHFSRFYESKVALLIFTKELAKRTIKSGVVVSYVNTGLVEIELYRDISWLFLLCHSLRTGQGLKSATESALSVLFCFLEDSVQTGEYYSSGQLLDHTTSVPASVNNDELAKKLWEVSKRLTGTFNERKITNIPNRRKIVTNDFNTELKIRLEQHGRAE